jgi:uncharacterized protein YjbJ (UPF0337 family)
LPFEGASDEHLDPERETTMADDLSGKLNHLAGKVKEGVGDLLGDRQIEREGRLDQMEGRAEQDAARAEDALLDADARRIEARRAKELNRDLDRNL